MAAQLKKVKVVIKVQCGEDGRVFGSVTGKDISEALQAQYKFKLDKKNIRLESPIKATGEYDVEVWVHQNVTSTVHVSVIPNNKEASQEVPLSLERRTIMALEIGKKAPDFTLPSDSGKDVSLSDYLGKKVILYFYPKDNTSGCTLEAQAFRTHLADFEKLGYVVLGVSRDSVKKHCNFRDKNELNFPLLSDADEVVVNLYGVLKEKSMYGKKYMGIERSTFIIDEKGNLVKEYRKVKAASHVGDLLKDLVGK